MPKNRVATSFARIRRSAFLQKAADFTDGELLNRYLARQDEDAFEALVRRLGPMVFGVCRRILGNNHDVEDAFQATFLVLVRKAASIVRRDNVAGWLHGVAYRAALKARLTKNRLRARERQVSFMPEPVSLEEGIWLDLLPILDKELALLPAKFRLPIILCDLEGKTRKEAADHLGWPPGTVAGRLAEGRALLARRLAKYGVVVSAGMLAALLPQQASSACVPMALVSSTVKAAVVTAAGKAAAGSTSAAALAEGVIKVMLLSKLKIVGSLALVLVLVGTGIGLLTRQAFATGVTAVAEDDTNKEKASTSAKNTLTLKRLRVDAVDAGKLTISVSTITTVHGLKLESLDGVTIMIDGGAKGGIIKGGTLKIDGATLKIITDVHDGEGKRKEKKAERLKGEANKDATAKPKTETSKELAVNMDLLIVGETQGDTTLKGLHVAKEAPISVKGKPAKLSDVKAGMCVTLELGTENDQIIVRSIKAE
jgi:RNA polymerase sigma factor (sigma-70 family)